MIEHNGLKVSARPQVITGCLTLIVLIAGLGVWATRAKIIAAVVSPGIVEVESNRQIVQHPAGGVVAEIYARDGQNVAPGEVLLRLDVGRQRAELVLSRRSFSNLLPARIGSRLNNCGARRWFSIPL
jgi:HlyD family secretion protein